MTRFRLAALIVLFSLGQPSVRAQEGSDKKQQELLRLTHSVLLKHQVETKSLPNEMPVTKLLSALESQLPKGKKISLRLDKDAFGDKYDALAATMIAVPRHTIYLDRALDIVTVTLKCDYRIGAGEITLTTRERALTTAEYDIRALVAKPEFRVPPLRWPVDTLEEARGIADPAFRNASPATRAAILAKNLVTLLDDPRASAQESVQILNAARLEIRATGTRHAAFAMTLSTFERLADLAIISRAKLYEVDDAFYTRLKNVKYVPIEELERIFVEGKKPKGESLHALLAKQKLILTGDEIKVDDGQNALLLSRHVVSRCGPSAADIVKGEKTPQVMFEGVSFTARVSVSPDRRFIGVDFAEKAQTPVVRKVKAWTPDQKLVDADVPLVREMIHTRPLELADGGSILVPVHYRPRSVQDANRWWVLSITSRVYMQEEERRIREGAK